MPTDCSALCVERMSQRVSCLVERGGQFGLFAPKLLDDRRTAHLERVGHKLANGRQFARDVAAARGQCVSNEQALRIKDVVQFRRPGRQGLRQRFTARGDRVVQALEIAAHRRLDIRDTSRQRLTEIAGTGMQGDVEFAPALAEDRRDLLHAGAERLHDAPRPRIEFLRPAVE